MRSLGFKRRRKTFAVMHHCLKAPAQMSLGPRCKPRGHAAIGIWLSGPNERIKLMRAERAVHFALWCAFCATCLAADLRCS